MNKTLQRLLKNGATADDLERLSRPELEELVLELQSLANNDGLTHLDNHRYFQSRAARHLKRLERSGAPAAFFVVDVDDFKRVNDTLGHKHGDAVLRKVAGVLTETLRPDDHVGRWGGEEFAALLPEISLEVARKTAERVRAAVEDATTVTVSIGVSHTDEASYQLDDLFAAADAAMYAAKAAGRNRVELASPDQTQKKAAGA